LTDFISFFDLFSNAKREMWGIVLGVLLGIVLTLLFINLVRTRMQPQVIVQEIPVNQYTNTPYYWGPWGYGGYGGYGSGGYSGGIAHHGGGHGGGGHGGGGHGGR
jgi:uncharacterized membrane protein YgcG